MSEIIIPHADWCTYEAHRECCNRDDPAWHCDCGTHRLQLKVDKLAWGFRRSKAEARRLRERRRWHSQRRQDAEMEAARLRVENKRLEAQLQEWRAS